MTAAPVIGASPTQEGVRFCVWAPDAQTVAVVLEESSSQDFPLEKTASGYFEGLHPRARTGSLYRYRVNGQGPYPDPASRFQPQGVHGPSQVMNPQAFPWSDKEWRGIELADLSLYELHVRAFTPQGTFAGVIERLPYLADLGITALEIMPVAEFAGSRNWGYDGVSLFAPSHTYGSPDDLRKLVDRAHALNLAVFMDVVYNHLGPDGNYLSLFSPFYFTARHKTPWGSAVNFDSDHAAEARSFFIQNARQWVVDYHMDGLRLDATHAMMDDSAHHFLAELSENVRTALPGRKTILIAEDHRNLAKLIKPEKEGGWGIDAVWADDFHHEVRRSLAGDKEGYFEDFTGSLEDLASTIQNGWFFHGQYASHFGSPRGTPTDGIPYERFVFCIQNHDQVGNRALGERLNEQIDPASYRAASTLLLTIPETPLLFMGQEWASPSPFLYFTDHHDELGKLVTEGRRAEFKSFSAFSDPAVRQKIPDPQAPDTFDRSRLRWSKCGQPPHAQTLTLYTQLLAWRKKRRPSLISPNDFSVRVLHNQALWLDYKQEGKSRSWIVIQWKGAGRHELEIPVAMPWNIVLSTETSDVAVDPRAIGIQSTGSRLIVQFQRPGAVILTCN